VPDRYAHFFASATEILQSHLGWDPGAREIGAFLAQQFQAPFYKCESTRLLVEPNRSLHSESLFSSFVQGLTASEREEVLNQFYFPHRRVVEEWVRSSAVPALHLSVHSFTPVFKGVVRDVDIGLLFDPGRENEVVFCDLWRNALVKAVPAFRTRFNEPYKGTDDGFTNYHRPTFTNEEYLGIELEVNQRFVGTSEFEAVMQCLSDSLHHVLTA